MANIAAKNNRGLIGPEDALARIPFEQIFIVPTQDFLQVTGKSTICSYRRRVSKKMCFSIFRDGEYMSDYPEQKSPRKIGTANGKKESICHQKMPHAATKSIERGDGKSVGLLYRFGEFGQRVARTGQSCQGIKSSRVGLLNQRFVDFQRNSFESGI